MCGGETLYERIHFNHENSSVTPYLSLNISGKQILNSLEKECLLELR